jgi:hypothetical protein
MIKISLDQALENIYASLNNGNEDIDLHIVQLKNALGSAKTIIVDPARLAQNNRQGRKMMQSYFKKRGVEVTFS